MFGASDLLLKSAGKIDLPQNVVTTESGRKLYRHSSGMGTVMVYVNDQGIERQTIILDAAYRFTMSKPNALRCRASGMGISTGTLKSNMTDEQLMDAFAQRDIFSSREYTNEHLWTMRYFPESTIVEAACRQILVKGEPCGLASLEILKRIYIERENLDALDPTLDDSSNLAMALGSRNANGNFKLGNMDRVYSSTANNKAFYYVNYTGSAGYESPSGKVYAVIPVLDIDLAPLKSDRKVYRHKSDIGSVIEYHENGVLKKVLVPDGAYRKCYSASPPTMPSQLTAYGNDIAATSPYVNGIGGSINTYTYLAQYIPDSWIDEHIFSDPNSSKQNSSILYEGNFAAVKSYCRNNNLAGMPFDLPNLQTLARIYCEAENLDALDKSMDGTSNAFYYYPIGSMCGGSLNGNSIFMSSMFLMSSTRYNSKPALINYYGGIVEITTTGAKNYGIVPVLDLDPATDDPLTE